MQKKQVGSFGGEAADGGEVKDGVAGLGKDGCARHASKSSENGSKVSNMSGESVLRGLWRVAVCCVLVLGIVKMGKSCGTVVFRSRRRYLCWGEFTGE